MCLRASCVYVWVGGWVGACVCVFMRAPARARVSLASDSSETIEVISIKFGRVTASDMLMHHVIMILALAFIQGHTYLNHENNKCLIISETIQVMPIEFVVKIARLTVY